MSRISSSLHPLLALAAILLIAGGCVRRRLTVRTTPPGALVSVDNQIIGTSPAASSFTYYGTREIRVERDGYRTETIQRNLSPPWYQCPPLDFMSETLWPWDIRDERIIDVQLVPQEVPSTTDVLQRATALREQSRQGTAGVPSISVPTAASPPQPTGVPMLAPPTSTSLPPGGIVLP